MLYYLFNFLCGLMIGSSIFILTAAFIGIDKTINKTGGAIASGFAAGLLYSSQYGRFDNFHDPRCIVFTVLGSLLAHSIISWFLWKK